MSQLTFKDSFYGSFFKISKDIDEILLIGTVLNDICDSFWFKSRSFFVIQICEYDG